jgi:hypothetical protein
MASKATTKPRVILTPKQLAQLRAETLLSERTIKAWAANDPDRKFNEATLETLRKAIAKFGGNAARRGDPA